MVNISRHPLRKFGNMSDFKAAKNYIDESKHIPSSFAHVCDMSGSCVRYSQEY